MVRTLILPAGKVRKNISKFFKKHPELKQKAGRIINTLLKNPLSQSVGVHKLGGQLKNFYGADITPKRYRIVFAFDDEHVYLLNIGTHDDVY